LDFVVEKTCTLNVKLMTYKENKPFNNVYIKVFPAPRKNGFNIVGKCDIFRGRIRIYPKTFNYCYAFRKKYGKDYFFVFVGNRARAALIHELLHLKYINGEDKVQELSGIYFFSLPEKVARYEFEFGFVV